MIGTYRAFYCLYGDTINTAARMCKYCAAAPHATPAFAAAARATCLDFAMVASRGPSEIKGKGVMDTFDVCVREDRCTAFRAAILGDGAAAIAAARRIQLGVLASAFRRSSVRGSVAPTTVPAAPTMASVKRLSFSPVADLRLDDLDDENLAWVEDPRHRIDHSRVVLRDPVFERAFVASQAASHRQWLVAGLLLHMLAVAFQWRLVARPEYRYNLAAEGAGALEQAADDVATMLAVHWALSWACCGGLMFALHGAAARATTCSWHFLGLKLVHLAVCIAATARLPAVWGWTLGYTLEMLLLNGWMGVISFRGTVGLATTSCVAYLASAAALVAVRPETVLRAVGFTVGVILLSRSSNLSQRVRWRLLQLYGSALRRLHQILFDILPEGVAREMVR